MALAVGYDLLKSLPNLTADLIPLFAIGFVTSFLAAGLAIRLFISFVSRHTLSAFALYRIALAILIWGLM